VPLITSPDSAAVRTAYSQSSTGRRRKTARRTTRPAGTTRTRGVACKLPTTAQVVEKPRMPCPSCSSRSPAPSRIRCRIASAGTDATEQRISHRRAHRPHRCETVSAEMSCTSAVDGMSMVSLGGSISMPWSDTVNLHSGRPTVVRGPGLSAPTARHHRGECSASTRFPAASKKYKQTAIEPHSLSDVKTIQLRFLIDVPSPRQKRPKLFGAIPHNHDHAQSNTVHRAPSSVVFAYLLQRCVCCGSLNMRLAMGSSGYRSGVFGAPPRQQRPAGASPWSPAC